MAHRYSEVINHIAARLPVRPAAYLCLFVIWAILLWFLSARSPGPNDVLPIAHLDKVLHFFYFACGGFTLAAYGGLQWPVASRLKLLMLVTVVSCAIGRLDEYHQGFIPGRSGNDSGDWLADTLGGFFGAWFVIRYILAGMAKKQQHSNLDG